jgi:hypothetical protein
MAARPTHGVPEYLVVLAVLAALAAAGAARYGARIRALFGVPPAAAATRIPSSR